MQLKSIDKRPANKILGSPNINESQYNQSSIIATIHRYREFKQLGESLCKFFFLYIVFLILSAFSQEKKKQIKKDKTLILESFSLCGSNDVIIC